MVNRHGEFGKRLVSLKSSSETHREFAKRLGIHYGTLSRILHKETPPGRLTLEKISRATGKPIDWLLGATGEAKPSDKKRIAAVTDEPPHQWIPMVPFNRIAKFFIAASQAGAWSHPARDRISTHLEGFKLIATKVVDASMEPALKKGDVLIVNGSTRAKNGDFVIALAKGKALLGKLVIIDNRKVIQPLNEKFNHAILNTKKGDSIIGKVVERRSLF